MATAEVQRATATATAVHDNKCSKEQENMDQLELVDKDTPPCSKVTEEHDPCAAKDVHGGNSSVCIKEEERKVGEGAVAVVIADVEGEGIAQELGACRLADDVQHHHRGSAPTEEAEVKEPADSGGRALLHACGAKKKEKAAAKGAVGPIDDDDQTNNEVVAAPAADKAPVEAAEGGDNQLALQDDKEYVCETGKKAHEE